MKPHLLIGLLSALVVAQPVSAEGDGRYRLPSGGFGVLGQNEPQAAPSKEMTEARAVGRFEDTVDLRTSWFLDAARATGRLDIETEVKDDLGKPVSFACTATAITADLILTNAHCDKRKGRFKTTRMTFSPNYRDLRDGSSTARHAVKLPAVEYGDASGHDYAIYQLTKPLANFKAPPLRYRDVVAGEPLVVVGHPEAQPVLLSRGGCQSDPNKPTDGMHMLHRCATRDGSSGSLVFGLDGAIVGLHHRGGVQLSGRTLGKALQISALMDKSPVLKDILTTAALEPQALRLATRQDVSGAEGMCLLAVGAYARAINAVQRTGEWMGHRLFVDVTDEKAAFLGMKLEIGSKYWSVFWGQRGEIFGSRALLDPPYSKGSFEDSFNQVPVELERLMPEKAHAFYPTVAAILPSQDKAFWFGLTLLNKSTYDLVIAATNQSYAYFDAKAKGVLKCIDVADITYLIDPINGVEMTVAEYLDLIRVDRSSDLIDRVGAARLPGDGQ